MKNLKQIEAEIRNLTFENNARIEISKKDINKISKRIEFLKSCKHILQEISEADFLKNQLLLAEQRLETYNRVLRELKAPTKEMRTEMKKEIEKIYSPSASRTQIRTLNYILQ